MIEYIYFLMILKRGGGVSFTEETMLQNEIACKLPLLHSSRFPGSPTAGRAQLFPGYIFEFPFLRVFLLAVIYFQFVS